MSAGSRSRCAAGGVPLAQRLLQVRRQAAAAPQRALRRSPRGTRPSRRCPLSLRKSARAGASRERPRGGRTGCVSRGGCVLACSLALRCRRRRRSRSLRGAPLLHAARAARHAAARRRRRRHSHLRRGSAQPAVSASLRRLKRSNTQLHTRTWGLNRLMSRAKRFLSKLMPPASSPRKGSAPGAAIT